MIYNSVLRSTIYPQPAKAGHLKLRLLGEMGRIQEYCSSAEIFNMAE